MSSWDSLTLFGGSLHSSIFQPILDPLGKVDIQKASAIFSTWIQSLRNSPLDHGIAPERMLDVLKVLNTFFPAPKEDQTLFPRRINCEEATTLYGNIVPVQVGFGPKNLPIAIVDAPNALAYVFSCAIPPIPESEITFDNYFLPLCVYFGWFLYLAFLVPSSALTAIITNVPLEVCVLYLPDASKTGSPIFCLGATWAGADPGDAYSAGRTENQDNAMDRWQSENLILPGTSIKTSAQLPSLTSTVKRTAARRLNEYILGKSENDSSKTPFLDPLITGVFFNVPGVGKAATLPNFVEAVSVMVKAEAMQPFGIQTTPDHLISHSLLAPKLMELLYTFVDSLSDLTDAQKLLENFMKLVRFYITPHVFDPLTEQEIPLGQNSKAVIEPLASSLPLLLMNRMIKKLKSLKCHLDHVYESNDDEVQFVETEYFITNTTAYGRCAEAFPIYTLSSRYFDDALAVNRLRDIRGCKILVRALGQAVMGGAFFTSFSKANLDSASFQTMHGQVVNAPVVSLPTNESKILLQQAHSRTEQDLESYSEDMRIALPKTFDLISTKKMDNPL